MKGYKVLFLSALACLALLSACSERTLAAREGRIFFAVSEHYQDGKEGVAPSILLSMNTEKIYPCCNYSIEAYFQRFLFSLSVDIRGIRQPDLCLTALGPASWGDFLELDDGVYSLELSDGPLNSSYELEVTEEALTVSRPSGHAPADFASPEFLVWWRYPRNSFVVLCGTMEDTAWIYEDFLQRLRGAVELEEIEFPADGELGYPRAPEGHYVDHPARYFVYDEEADFAAAGEVLRAYVRDVIGQPLGVSIWLRNWKNESFRSWMMDGALDK